MRLAPRSLSARLLIGSAMATLIALGLVLVLMHLVLTRFVTGQIDQRLDNKIVVLVSQVRVAADGTLSLDGEADGPPFDKRHHRSFWVVRGPRNVLRTRWLADSDVAAPSAATIAEAFARPTPGPEPDGTHPRTLHGEGFGGIAMHERIARAVIEGTDVTILVAAPAAAIGRPVGEAMTNVGLGVLALGVALAGLAFAQVRLGLRPLAALRRQLAEVGEGRRDRLPVGQMREIAPLVEEMNRLLEGHAANLDKARRHVANLAHGLKTPLATLQLGVERLEGPGKDEMRLLLGEIDLRVRHHLGRARAGALAGPERSRTQLAPRLADIGDALRRIHADRGVSMAIDCPADLALACEGNDVDEIFGNLLDNAFKFARRRVACEARLVGRAARITITDDGPGLRADQIDLVLQPGRRLDEALPGFGFGLTIARELVELYGGELTLKPEAAGLEAVVVLPVGSRQARDPRAS